MWYIIHTIEYSFCHKKERSTWYMDEHLRQYTKWKEPVTKDYVFYVVWFHLSEMSRLGKYLETERRLVVAKGQECLGKIDTNEFKITFWSEENILG